MDKRKVLIITYAWPPMEGVGLARVLKFTKFLPDYGWIPIILTIKNGIGNRSNYLPSWLTHIKVYRTEYKDVIENFKKMFCIQIFKKRNDYNKNLGQKPSSKIHKLRSFFREMLSIPDAQIGWYKFAALSGKRILNEEKIDLIFSTSPPETAHLIARHLKKCFDIPWLADLRDPWANNHFRSENPILKEALLRCLERSVLKDADRIITVSEPWAGNLRSSIGRSDTEVKVIENGFDGEDFRDIVYGRNEKFTIVYTGKLHKYHQPVDNFFGILKDLVTENRIDRNRINVKFYIFGYDRPGIRMLTELYGLDGIVYEFGKVDYQRSIQIQMSSDVLLLVSWQGKGGEGVYTTKIYDYIGARRPILVLGSEKGIIYDLIRRTSSGIVADNKQSLREAIIRLYGEYIKNGYIEYNGNEQEILKCTRRWRTKELADIFNSVVESKF